MRIGIGIIIFFLSLIALVAEIVLYLMMGVGAAVSGATNSVPAMAMFFVCLMVFTAAIGILAPVSAVIGTLVKKPQVSYYIMLPSLGIVFVGLALFLAVSGSVARTAANRAPGDGADKSLRDSAESAPTWQYQEDEGKMGEGKTYFASVKSTNTVDFAFPYGGPQHGELTLRIDPHYGKDVIFSVEQGQILTGIYGTTVRVSLDGGKPQSFHAVSPADHRTTSVFISDYSRFVSGLKKAKVARVEVAFFQSGDQVFEFNVAGLQWESSTQKKK